MANSKRKSTNTVLINEFLDRYITEYDYYQNASRLCAAQCEKALEESGIRAIVTYRAKRLRRLRQKVKLRAGPKKYRSLSDIYDDISDLAGVRIALYFPGDKDKVDKIINNNFIHLKGAISHPGGSRTGSGRRSAGYNATHYLVTLNPKYLSETQGYYVAAPIEIQVASVLMHAWAEVEHDLTYKPLSGKVSSEEIDILDELNNLVNMGEIALERLQKAVENRVSEGKLRFNNHYELAAYIDEKIRSQLGSDPKKYDMGRLNLLFKMLEAANLNKPDFLEPYVQGIDISIELRPIADKIIDQIIAENERLYGIYRKIKLQESQIVPFSDQKRDVKKEELESKVAAFISQWINFEKIMRKIINKLQPSILPSKIMLPQVWEKTGIFGRDLIGEINYVRQIRNKLVHGIEIPDPDKIKTAEDILAFIMKFLKEHENEKIRAAAID